MSSSRRSIPNIPTIPEINLKLDEINKNFNKRFYLEKVIAKNWQGNEIIMRHLFHLYENLGNNLNNKLADSQRKECLLQFILGLEKGLQYVNNINP